MLVVVGIVVVGGGGGGGNLITTVLRTFVGIIALAAFGGIVLNPNGGTKYRSYKIALSRDCC